MTNPSAAKAQVQNQPGKLAPSPRQSSGQFDQPTWEGGGKEPRHPDDVEADDGTIGTSQASQATWEGGGHEPRHPDDVETDE